MNAIMGELMAARWVNLAFMKLYYLLHVGAVLEPIWLRAHTRASCFDLQQPPCAASPASAGSGLWERSVPSHTHTHTHTGVHPCVSSGGRDVGHMRPARSSHTQECMDVPCVSTGFAVIQLKSGIFWSRGQREVFIPTSWVMHFFPRRMSHLRPLSSQRLLVDGSCSFFSSQQRERSLCCAASSKLLTKVFSSSVQSALRVRMLHLTSGDSWCKRIEQT